MPRYVTSGGEGEKFGLAKEGFDSLEALGHAKANETSNMQGLVAL